MAPKALLYPLVTLATAATVIASQAMISGVFSLTQQATHLGFVPRVRIVHTSYETQGQIYIPSINRALMIACIGLVLTFQSSSRLAGAYGIAVTADMAITSILFFFVLTRTWHWPLWKAAPLVLLFLLFDLCYFSANLFKIVDGGWFTLTVAAVIMTALTTWRDGRAALARKLQATRLPLKLFLDDVGSHKPIRVPGTAVFMSISPVGVPSSLLHHYKHNHVLHERVLILSILSVDVPTVSPENRLEIEELGHGFYRLIARYGFMEGPDVPDIMRVASSSGLELVYQSTTFFLSRETLLTSGDTRMMQWRKKLFTFMSRNAVAPTTYFGIPLDRVVELGIQIEI
jgi:KUP system potassium uptake protein